MVSFNHQWGLDIYFKHNNRPSVAVIFCYYEKRRKNMKTQPKHIYIPGIVYNEAEIRGYTQQLEKSGISNVEIFSDSFTKLLGIKSTSNQLKAITQLFAENTQHFAQAVKETFSRLSNDEETIIHSQSMGGNLALYLASQYPNISKQILMQPARRFSLNVSSIIKDSAKKSPTEEEIDKAFVNGLISEPLLIKLLFQSMRLGTQGLGGVEIPSLIMYSEYDPLIPKATIKKLYETLKQQAPTELIKVMGGRHVIFHQPQMVNAASEIARFVSTPKEQLALTLQNPAYKPKEIL